MNSESINVCDTEYLVTTQANSIAAEIHKLENNTYVYAGNIAYDDDCDIEYLKNAIFEKFHSQQAKNEQEWQEWQENEEDDYDF